MTKEEAIEFFKGTDLHFQDYYKYTFNYAGVKNDKVIKVSFGGGVGDNIYRTSFYPVERFTVYDSSDFYYDEYDDYVQFTEIP